MDLSRQEIRTNIFDATFYQVDVQNRIIRLEDSTFQRERGLYALQKHADLSACHDSNSHSQSPRCYPQTRASTLGRIEQWRDLAAKGPGASRCLWLSGPAGGGKSAIAQTLAERWSTEGLLAASFFPLDFPAGHLEKVVPTIAQQLSKRFPAALSHIASALDSDIFTKKLEIQMEQLVVRPLTETYRLNSNPFLPLTPKIVVIDGLDKCGDITDQGTLLSVLLDALSRADIPLHLFITSRPEPHIADIFAKYSKVVEHVVLDGVHASSADVELFVRSRLAEVDINISKDAMSTIVRRSSGQFLYAAAAVDYICSPGANAEERMREILTSQSSGYPFQQMDAVFAHIMECIEPSDLGVVMDVLAWLMIYRKDTQAPAVQNDPDLHLLSLPWLAKMLVLEPDKILRAFRTLRSLFDVPDRTDTQRPLRPYHAAIFDFLARVDGKSPLFMDEPEAHRRVAICASKRLLGMTSTSDDIEIAESLVRLHLPHARVKEDLAQHLASLVGFRFLSLQSGEGAGLTSPLNAAPVLRCDTRQVILDFLKTYLSTREYKTSTSAARRISVQNRLAILWFRWTLWARVCTNQGCSCTPRPRSVWSRWLPVVARFLRTIRASLSNFLRMYLLLGS